MRTFTLVLYETKDGPAKATAGPMNEKKAAYFLAEALQQFTSMMSAGDERTIFVGIEAKDVG